MRLVAGIVMVLLSFVSYGQSYPYRSSFDEAYQLYPDLPPGILQAIAFTNTRLTPITVNEPESCTGMPVHWGIMGLVADGKGFFNENLINISLRSGSPVQDIKTNPHIEILAYAKALSQVLYYYGGGTLNDMVVKDALSYFSEIPGTANCATCDYALASQLYSIFSFLNDPAQQQRYSFTNSAPYDLQQIFGANNLAILSAPGVTIQGNHISNSNGQTYITGRLSTDYAPALWDPASSCNYSSRSGAAITAVTIHTTQGSYASTIAWFQNCSASVSAHYVIRSIDGQVTQMVHEAEKAWHVGSENSYTIGIEHEGYVSQPMWYTTVMYMSSANLVKDIINSGYGISGLSCYRGTDQGELNSCYRIKGHSHFPNQTHTDPGTNWSWPYYYSLINDSILTYREYTCSGSFVDAGGPSGNYSNLTTYQTVIQPPGADTVSITFSYLNLEQDYDSLYIYDGDGIHNPLLGAYTGTQNPGTVVAPSGKMTLLFTSDCIINASGWEASWSCSNCPPLAVSLSSMSPQTCSAGGSIELDSLAGYQYTWADGPTGTQRNNLNSGTYTVTMSNNTGCAASHSYVVQQTDTLLVSHTVTDASCSNLNNGTIVLNMESGTAPFQYQWSDGPGTSVRQGLTPGNYAFTVTDDQGCSFTGNTAVTAPMPISVHGLQTNAGTGQPFSYDSISGGTPPYTVSLNQCTQLIDSNRCTLSITDAHQCSWDTTFSYERLTGIAPVVNSSDWSIYPNPSTGTISIDMRGLDATPITVYLVNITGTVVYRNVFYDKNVTHLLPGRKLSAGVYYVIIETTGIKSRKRLIVL